MPRGQRAALASCSLEFAGDVAGAVIVGSDAGSIRHVETEIETEFLDFRGGIVCPTGTIQDMKKALRSASCP